jgi:ferrochelatase
MPNYDAILFVSFGGPEGPDDVMPFLENVLRGKNVPRERMLEVAKHYDHFGGVSPINEQCRQLIAALEAELAEHGPQLPVYWGNRNWTPMLPDTLQKMADDGVQRALAFFTSGFSCYSGCRQYREDIARASAQVQGTAPEVDKIRVFFNHPGFLEPMIESVRSARERIATERRTSTPLLFTAHSIPMSMAENCRYEAQLREACRIVAESAGHANWELVYQSRSGPPQQPWLEPDICDHIEALHGKAEESDQRLTDLMILPIGFISDHLEVLFDLDTEANTLCDKLGIKLQRIPTVGTHPRFVQMIRELITERTAKLPQRLALGNLPASHDVCPEDCCLYTPTRRPTTTPS